MLFKSWTHTLIIIEFSVKRSSSQMVLYFLIGRLCNSNFICHLQLNFLRRHCISLNNKRTQSQCRLFLLIQSHLVTLIQNKSRISTMISALIRIKTCILLVWLYLKPNQKVLLNIHCSASTRLYFLVSVCYSEHVVIALQCPIERRYLGSKHNNTIIKHESQKRFMLLSSQSLGAQQPKKDHPAVDS